MDLEEAYRRLQREYQTVNRIFNTLTPEAGEIYEFYRAKLEDVRKRYIPKKFLLEIRRMRPKKIKKKPEVQAQFNSEPVNFRVEW